MILLAAFFAGFPSGSCGNAMSDQTKGVWCGRCHRDVEREPGSGTAWTLWVCPYCRGSLGVRVRREDIGPVDTAALDTDYEPIFLTAAVPQSPGGAE